MHRCLVLVLIVLLVCGCGGPVTAPVPVRPGALAPPTTRGPSSALARSWPFDEPTTAIYVDVGGLSKTRVLRELIKNERLGGVSFTPSQRACFDAFFGNVKELAIGGDHRGVVTVARAESNPSWLRPCALAFDFATSRLDGATEAWTGRGARGPRRLRLRAHHQWRPLTNTSRGR